MTEPEFRKAVESLCFGIVNAGTNRRKDVIESSKHFARGMGAKPAHMKLLANLTINDLFEKATSYRESSKY